MPGRRATLLCPSGPASDPNRNHLFVILNDPHGPGQQVLMVSVSSVKDGVPHDPTCYLERGEHPFINHRSYVFYARCRVESVAGVDALIKQGYFIEKEPVSEVLFDRIVEGLLESKFTKPFAREFIRGCL